MNEIGLKPAETKQIATQLNQLLASYQVFYMNVRGFHWNIKGDNFFELHAKFEEIYTNLLEKIDEIAERVVTLGERPLHAYSQYIEQSSIKEAVNISDGKSCVQSLLAGLAELLVLQRAILSSSADNDDEGTNSLMSDYIKEQEKLVWMFSAYNA